jgi:hypothetical protein
VHHDLRPEKIILGPDWRVVIMDLGTQLPQLPEEASPLGLAAKDTAAHGASEPGPHIVEDRQVDITALGLIGYQLFNNSVEQLAPLSSILRRCIAQDSAQRFGSVEEILSLLGEPLPPGLPQADKWPRLCE